MFLHGSTSLSDCFVIVISVLVFLGQLRKDEILHTVLIKPHFDIPLCVKLCKYCSLQFISMYYNDNVSTLQQKLAYLVVVRMIRPVFFEHPQKLFGELFSKKNETTRFEKFYTLFCVF